MNLARLITYSFFIFNTLFCFAQNNKVLELKVLLNDSKQDTSKVNILLDLAKTLYPISSDEAIEYSTQARELAQKLNYKRAEVLALKYNGLAYYYQGEYIHVILNWEDALKKAQEINDKELIANMLSNLGAVYNNQGDDGKALDFYEKALVMAEEIKDTMRKVMTLNNIGLIYSKKTESLEIALENYKKSLELSKLLNDDYAIGTASYNIGEVYFNQENIHEALNYFVQALLSYRKDKSLHESDVLNYLGKIYYAKGDYSSAISYQQKSYDIAKSFGAQLEMVNALQGMAKTYNRLDNHAKALKLNNEAFEIAKRIGAKYQKLEGLKGLAINNAKLNNYKEAYNYLNNAMVLKDTIYSEKNQEKINQVRVQYEVQNMLKENEILKKDIEIKEVLNNKQQLVIFLLVIGFLITSLLIGMLFKANKQKKKANNALKDKNKLVSSQQKEILDSIVYAKRIQFSALPKIEEIEGLLDDVFVLFKPKDVVSGDFYWFAEVEGQLVVTVADCTGHGVPGAFMSMLGMSMLELIVKKEYMTQPDVVLRKLRKEVVKALGQTGELGEQKDGMDMSLCSINLETLEMQWAGANNPCLLVRDGILTDIKPDKMPIAIYIKMDKYKLHTIQLQKGDVIYLITDGYPDQFGGPKDRKFMSKKLKVLLAELSSVPMSEQREILDTTIESWMNDHDKKYGQTDDITIMGLKI